MELYKNMAFTRCGNSGLFFPKIALGLWHNFGDVDDSEEALKMLSYAFDYGITHFDLADNYGTPAGSAERNFGKLLATQFAGHRDEMLISTKAGHDMWEGPYGTWGSRKHLMAGIDQSLRRMGLEYVDIFYSHRYDPGTPLEETMGALSDIVRSGKALYVGLSKYPADKLQQAIDLLKQAGTPCLVYQDRYNIFAPQAEETVLPVVRENRCGFVAFSPLAQGLLSDKYLHGIPENSRAAHSYGFLKRETITPDMLARIAQLNEIAASRGQSLAQMALAWCLRRPELTSVIIGASSLQQLQDNLLSLRNTEFSAEELNAIKQAGL